MRRGCLRDISSLNKPINAPDWTAFRRTIRWNCPSARSRRTWAINTGAQLKWESHGEHHRSSAYDVVDSASHTRQKARRGALRSIAEICSMKSIESQGMTLAGGRRLRQAA